MIVTKTPLRITFCGGGSDYLSHSRIHGGVCTNACINKHVYITARRLPPFFEYKTRLSYSEIETVADNADIRHKSAKACVYYMQFQDEPLEITHYADMPGRSGLGSSSAFTVGLLNALSCLKGQRFLSDDLGETSVHVEHNLVKENVGQQDQFCAAYGGLNVMRFYKDGSHSVRPIPCNYHRLNEHLLLFFTRVHRTASDVAASYVDDLPRKTRECLSLTRMANESVEFIACEKYEELGNLLNESWRIKRGLSELVSNNALDDVFSRGRVAGAWGGKLLGAGGGGCFLFIAPPEKHEKIKLALKDLLYVPFRFQMEGSTVIHYERDE